MRIVKTLRQRQCCGYSLWLGVMLLHLGWPHVAEAAEAEIDWSRILAGEVIVAAVKNRAGIPGVRVMFAVTAPRQQIWSVLVDYENFPRIFRGIKELRVLEQDAHGAKVWFRTPVAFMDYRYVLHRRYVEPGRRLTWTRLSGSFQRIAGGWEIRQTPRRGMQLLVYESFVKIGQLVPTQFVQRGALRRAREMGVRLRT